MTGTQQEISYIVREPREKNAPGGSTGKCPGIE